MKPSGQERNWRVSPCPGFWFHDDFWRLYRKLRMSFLLDHPKCHHRALHRSWFWLNFSARTAHASTLVQRCVCAAQHIHNAWEALGSLRWPHPMWNGLCLRRQCPRFSVVTISAPNQVLHSVHCTGKWHVCIYVPRINLDVVELTLWSCLATRHLIQ